MPLIALDGTILAQLWPASMVVLGLKVCTVVRCALRIHTGKVIFRRSRSPRKISLVSKEIDFCKDLLQFQHSFLEVELHLNNHCSVFVTILEGAAKAIANGFSGRFVLLNISNAGVKKARLEGTQGMYTEYMSMMPFLEHLDLSNSCRHLSWSAGMANTHTNLKSLRISSNDIDPPDALRLISTLQQLPCLELLDLSGCCVWDSSTLSHSMVTALHCCTSLVHLNLSRYLRPPANHLASLLRSLPNLAHLNLDGNQIGHSVVEELVVSLSGLLKLTTLDLGCNRLGSEGTARLAARLPDLPALTELRLAWNHITDDGATALAHTFDRLGALQRLNIAGNGIHAEGGGVLVASLRHLSTLVALDVSANPLWSSVVERMAEQLAHACPSLSALNLTYVYANGIPAAVMAGLARWSALTELRLSGNELEARELVELGSVLGGACSQDQVEQLSGGQRRKHARARADREACGAMLRQCAHLRVLEMAGCSLGPEAARWVGEGMRGLSRLERLALGGNKMATDALRVLCAALPTLSSLSHLDLSGNSLDGSGMQGLAATAAECVSLQHLELGWNQVESSGLTCLAEGLPGCRRLRYLGLAYNLIDDEGVLSLAQSMGGCEALERIKLSGNAISFEGASALVAAGRACRLLHEVDVRGLVSWKEKEGGQRERTVRNDVQTCGRRLCLLADGLLHVRTW